MFEKKGKESREKGLAQELESLVAPELRELPAQVARQLLADESFMRGRELYHRVVSARVEDKPILSRVREEFALFATAHALRASGKTVPEVAAQLQNQSILPWLRLGHVPDVLFENDPLRGAQFVRQISIPKGSSSEFAYLLGAYAGTARLGATGDEIKIWSDEQKLVDRLSGAVFESCGLPLDRRVRIREGAERFCAGIQAQELVVYLRDVSAGNSVVPWKHIQTSAERREFLRGFLDFSGGTVSVEYHRLSIARSNNLGLLEEVLVVFKREGILARIGQGRMPSLHVESNHGLARIRDLQLVHADRLRVPLEAALEAPLRASPGRPEQYESVMRIAERLDRRGGATPDEIRRRLKMEGDSASELPLHIIRQWARGGHVPVSVVRLRENEAIERRLFRPQRSLEVGESIKARFAGYLSPQRVTSAIAEYLGDADSLARASRVPKWIVHEIVRGERFPTRAEYRLLLGTVGLSLTGELERGITPPEARDVERWLKSDGERRVFGSYSASICLLAREAFSRGDDPREAVRARLAKLMKRNDDMIIDESR